MLDGRPVLLLCSGNYLGLSDHPRVREAAAEAAMRWGAGAGSSRTVAGTMTIHRRLEERLADFVGRKGATVFGAGLEAAAGVIGALAGPGDVVFSDEFNAPAIADGCVLSGAQTFVYEHLDVEHLAWGIANVEAHPALIVSESVFGINGDLAPLGDLAHLAGRHRIRLMVDEAHGLGTLGADGRGAVAQAGLDEEVDVLMGSLDTALGSSGAFVACDEETTRYLRSAARTFIFCTAPPPASSASALVALELLEGRPELVRRLHSNAVALRRELDREGVEVSGYDTHIFGVPFGDPDLASRAASAALEQGVFAQALTPPTVSPSAASLRLSVTACHRPEELRAAARTLGQIVRRLTVREPLTARDLPREPRRAEVFDLEADERLAA